MVQIPPSLPPKAPDMLSSDQPNQASYAFGGVVFQLFNLGKQDPQPEAKLATLIGQGDHMVSQPPGYDADVSAAYASLKYAILHQNTDNQAYLTNRDTILNKEAPLISPLVDFTYGSALALANNDFPQGYTQSQYISDLNDQINTINQYPVDPNTVYSMPDLMRDLTTLTAGRSVDAGTLNSDMTAVLSQLGVQNAGDLIRDLYG